MKCIIRKFSPLLAMSVNAFVIFTAAIAHADVAINTVDNTLSAGFNDSLLNNNPNEFVGVEIAQHEMNFEPRVVIFAKKDNVTFTCYSWLSDVGESTFALLESLGSRVGPMGNLFVSKSGNNCTNITYTNLSRVPNPGVTKDYDDLAVVGGLSVIKPRSISLTESFEVAPINWVNTGAYAWNRISGKSPTANTGPLNAIQGSFYAYLETSSPFANASGNTAVLESGYFNATNNGAQAILDLRYHMYGSNIGSLYVDVLQANGLWLNNVWSRTGQQHTSSGAGWSSASINLGAIYSGTIKVRLRAVAVGGDRGDIAIDNLVVRY